MSDNSRVIKFRAWDRATNRMLETGFHVLGEVTCFGIIEQKLMEVPFGKTTLERIGDVEIMQFTGLQDKNGKEIWEGDIVQEDIETEYGKQKMNHDVEFVAGAFYPICMQPPDTFEVIGNIYEHPELLTQLSKTSD